MPDDKFGGSTRRVLGDVIAQARAQGWAVERTGKDHLRFVPTDKTQPIVHTAMTPGDRRAVQNIRSNLRRAGLAI